jgi:hypothetical protein
VEKYREIQISFRVTKVRFTIVVRVGKRAAKGSWGKRREKKEFKKGRSIGGCFSG